MFDLDAGAAACSNGPAFWVMPVFGDGRVPAQVRFLLAFVISLMIAPMMKGMPVLDPFSVGMLVLTLEQLLFGLLFGLCIQMLFMVMTSQSGDRVTKIHITMDSAQEKINNALKVLKFVHS